MNKQRTSRRKQRVGVVLSNNTAKTIVVRVSRLSRHVMYRKVVRRAITLKAHDQDRQAKVGDKVRIVETRPLSKDKRWRLKEIMVSSS